MALISCPECKKQVSSSAISCPNCGYPISKSGGNAVAAPSKQLRNCMDCGGQARVPCDCLNCSGSGEEYCPRCYEGEIMVGNDFISCPTCHRSRYITCSHCGGSGAGQPEKCDTCKGTGQLTFADFDTLMKGRQEAAMKREEAKRQAALKSQQEEALRKTEEAKRQAEIKKRHEEEARHKAIETQRRKEEKEQQELDVFAEVATFQKVIDKIEKNSRNGRCLWCGEKAFVSRKITVTVPEANFTGYIHRQCEDGETEIIVKTLKRYYELMRWLKDNGY